MATVLAQAVEGQSPAGARAQVEGTFVVAEHRGKRLGVIVTSACPDAARDLGVVARVRTGSDDEHMTMRAINHEFGFVPVEPEILLPRAAKRPRTLRSGASQL